MNRRMWSFNARELRVQAWVLAVSVWAFASYNVTAPGMFYRTGSIKGGDFVHFYVLGHLAATGQSELLYDTRAQQVVQVALVPASKDFWFLPVYGPQTALLFAGLAKMPYLTAAIAWALATIVLYLACVWVIWRTCPALRPHRGVMLPAALAFLPIYRLVTYGQTSVLPMVCLTVAYLALRADRRWWAGFALGSLVFKPQFGVAVGAVLIARREWRMVGGALIGVAAQWGLSIWAFGSGPMFGYFAALGSAPRVAALLEPDIFVQQSLRAFWSLLLPSKALAQAFYFVTALTITVMAIRLWRPSVSLNVRYGGLVLATILTSPHVGLYDLVLVAPGLTLAADHGETLPDRSRRRLRALVYFAFAVPLLVPLTASTRLQLTMPVLAALFTALCLSGQRRQVPETAKAAMS